MSDKQIYSSSCRWLIIEFSPLGLFLLSYLSENFESSFTDDPPDRILKDEYTDINSNPSSANISQIFLMSEGIYFLKSGLIYSSI